MVGTGLRFFAHPAFRCAGRDQVRWCDMPLKKYFAAVASFAALCVFPAAAAGEPMEWPCRGRCIDAAWIANKGWAYFFAGGRYWRYDIAHNKVDLGDTEVTYPRPLRTVPGFPSAWSSGVDAVLNGGDGTLALLMNKLINSPQNLGKTEP